MCVSRLLLSIIYRKISEYSPYIMQISYYICKRKMYVNVNVWLSTVQKTRPVQQLRRPISRLSVPFLCLYTFVNTKLSPTCATCTRTCEWMNIGRLITAEKKRGRERERELDSIERFGDNPISSPGHSICDNNFASYSGISQTDIRWHCDISVWPSSTIFINPLATPIQFDESQRDCIA